MSNDLFIRNAIRSGITCHSTSPSLTSHGKLWFQPCCMTQHALCSLNIISLECEISSLNYIFPEVRKIKNNIQDDQIPGPSALKDCCMILLHQQTVNIIRKPDQSTSRRGENTYTDRKEG